MCHKSGLSASHTQFWSTNLLDARCLLLRLGGGSLGGGVLGLLGTKVPQSVSPGVRGGPCAPPPRVAAPQSVRCPSCFCLGTGFSDWLLCSGLFLEDFLTGRLALQVAAVAVISRPFRPCVLLFLRFSGCVFWPRVFFGFLDLGACAL